MKNLLLLFFGLIIVIPAQFLRAQNPVISPEVRLGGYAIQKQASTGQIVGGGLITYHLSVSLPANSGPVTITDLITPPAINTINPQGWGSFSISGAPGLIIHQNFTIAGTTATAVVENTGNQPINFLITFTFRAPNGDINNNDVLSNTVSLTFNGSTISTSPVLTTISAQNPFSVGIGANVNQRPFSSTVCNYIDSNMPSPNVNYSFCVYRNCNSGCNLFLSNGQLVVNFPNNVFSNGSTTQFISIDMVMNGVTTPISVPSVVNGTTLTIPLPSGYQNHNICFNVVVNYGTPGSVTTDINVPVMSTLIGTNMGQQFTQMSQSIGRFCRNIQNSTDSLGCNCISDSALVSSSLAHINTMIGCVDNSFSLTMINKSQCSETGSLIFDVLIPPGAEITAVQYSTSYTTNWLNTLVTVEAFDALGNVTNMTSTYQQNTFNQFQFSPAPPNGIEYQRIRMQVQNARINFYEFGKLIISFYANSRMQLGTNNFIGNVSIINYCDSLELFRLNRQSTATTNAIVPAPRICRDKSNCSPFSIYSVPLPATNGQTAIQGGRVPFALQFMNTGSAALVNAYIEDLLPLDLTYVLGSARFYIVDAANGNSPCDFDDHNVPSTTINPIISIDPQTGRQNLRFNLPGPISGDCITEAIFGQNCWVSRTTRYAIVFEAEVGYGTPAGVSNNLFIVGGINSHNGEGYSAISNSASFNVAGRQSSTLQKAILLNGIEQNSASVQPGANATFRLRYTNTSNMNQTNIKFIDILPMNNGGFDGFMFNRSQNRGSNISVTPLQLLGCSVLGVNDIFVANGPASIFIDNLQNINLQELGVNNSNSGVNTPNWVPINNSNLGNARNIKWEFGNLLLQNGQSLVCDYTVQIPTSSTTGSIACNSFVASAEGSVTFNNGNVTINSIPIESQPVCVNVVSTACDCNPSNSLTTNVRESGLARATTWECGKGYSLACDRIMTFTANYSCNNTECSPIYRYEVIHVATGTIIASGTGNTFNLNVQNSGTHNLVWTVICGDRECVRCVQSFKVNCANQACACNNETSIRVTAENLTGKKSAQSIACDKEISVRCKQRVKFNASYSCLPGSCAARFEYTMTRMQPGFTPVSGTTASFTQTFNENGTYIIEWIAYCGNTPCKKCKTIVIVDGCVPPCNNCSDDEIKIVSDKEGASLQTSANGSQYILLENSFILNVTRNITEVTATILDFSIKTDDPMCRVQCMDPFMAATPYATTINSVSPLYSDGSIVGNQGANPNLNPRELVWRFMAPSRITNNGVNFTYSLPIGSNISCCRMEASFCVRFRFVDDKCNVCERTYCLSVPLNSAKDEKKTKLSFTRKK